MGRLSPKKDNRGGLKRRVFMNAIEIKPVEIIVIIAIAALLIFSLVFNIVRRKKGKNSCGCDCPSCAKKCDAGDDGKADGK